MVAGYHEIHQTVVTRFGGSICGEHGDGRVRAEFVPKYFGEELYTLFKQVKAAFDPRSEGRLDLLEERSEEHTSELQSPCNLVCRLLLEKKKQNRYDII